MRRAAIWYAGLATIVLWLGPTRTSAQVPVGFLPGLNSDSSLWVSTGSTLATLFNIAPFYPRYNTDDAFLVNRTHLGILDTTTVLVGHSAGGVLARFKGQLQPLAAVVTYASPNFGAPLEVMYPNFCLFVGGTGFDMYLFFADLIDPDDDWIVDELEPDYDFIGSVLGAACTLVVDALNLPGGTAGSEVTPNGGFVNDTLNAAGNVALEAVNVKQEVGVVVTTDNYQDAGVFKLMASNGAAIGHISQDVGATLEGIAAYLELSDPDDYHDLELARLAQNAGDDLLYMDMAWCQSVVGGFYICSPNDEAVPTWSQAMGRGTTEVDVPHGPVHTREAQNAVGPLTTAFGLLGIARR